MRTRPVENPPVPSECESVNQLQCRGEAGPKLEVGLVDGARNEEWSASDEQKLQEFILSKGMVIVPMEGDGNCMFRAIGNLLTTLGAH